MEAIRINNSSQLKMSQEGSCFYAVILILPKIMLLRLKLELW